MPIIRDSPDLNGRTEWRNVPSVERIVAVNQLIVLHPRFREGVELLRRCHQSAQDSAEPTCGALLGTSGVGKTSVIDHYRKLHPARETETATQQPVLKVTLQPEARPKGIAASGSKC